MNDYSGYKFKKRQTKKTCLVVKGSLKLIIFYIYWPNYLIMFIKMRFYWYYFVITMIIIGWLLLVVCLSASLSFYLFIIFLLALVGVRRMFGLHLRTIHLFFHFFQKAYFTDDCQRTTLKRDKASKLMFICISLVSIELWGLKILCTIIMFNLIVINVIFLIFCLVSLILLFIYRLTFIFQFISVLLYLKIM